MLDRLFRKGSDIAGLGEDELSKVAGLHSLLVRCDRLINFLASAIPELRRITSRSQPMLACYPGNGTHYVRHVDNPAGGNHRLLTCLVYLNEAWRTEDGGQLRIPV